MFPEMRFLISVTPHCTDLLMHVILLKSILLNKESIHYLTAETMAVIFHWSVFHLQVNRNGVLELTSMEE